MERTRLREARAKKQWTLEQAAEIIGCGVNSLHAWEKGRATPYATNKARLCEVYNATAAELDLEDTVTIKAGTAPVVIADPFSATDLTMKLLALAFVPRKASDVQANLTRIIEEFGMSTENKSEALYTRREAFEALSRLAMLPTISGVLTLTTQRQPGEIVTQCAASIAACWKLSESSDDADLALAFRGVSAYLPALKAIIENSSQFRKEAAGLAGQCELLRTLLGWHLQGLKQAAGYAAEAVKYCTEAGDQAMLLSVLDYQAWAYHYDNRPKQALAAIRKALPILAAKDSQGLPSQLLSGVYSTLALMSARNNQSGIAYLDKAATSFYSPKNDDERFVYMDYTKGDLVLNDAMVRYHARQYDDASKSFGALIDASNLVPRITLPSRSHIEALNIMTLSSLKNTKKDLEWTLHLWDAAMQGAKHLQSEQRFSEARLAYEVMEAVWPGDKRIAERREVALHW